MILENSLVPTEAGAGVSVVVIDYGCNLAHKELVDVVDLTPGARGSKAGHATHILGIIGTLAPRAKIYIVKVDTLIS